MFASNKCFLHRPLPLREPSKKTCIIADMFAKGGGGGRTLVRQENVKAFVKGRKND